MLRLISATFITKKKKTKKNLPSICVHFRYNTKKIKTTNIQYKLHILPYICQSNHIKKINKPNKNEQQINYQRIFIEKYLSLNQQNDSYRYRNSLKYKNEQQK